VVLRPLLTSRMRLSAMAVTAKTSMARSDVDLAWYYEVMAVLLHVDFFDFGATLCLPLLGQVRTAVLLVTHLGAWSAMSQLRLSCSVESLL